MRKIILLFSVLLGFSIQAQELTASETTFPYFDALEWKNNGILLLSRDPSGNQRKITLTFMADKDFSVWQESFNPSGKDYYYISGENARYIYFLDNLELSDGKLFYHQVSSAGNIKSSSAQIGQTIKRIDNNILFTDLTPIDVFTTDKALVMTYRYHDKKEKKYTDYVVTMTHHNMMLYTCKLGSISEEQLKDPKYSHWTFAGFNEDKIFFSVRDFLEKKTGWTIQTLTSKAVLTESRFIEEPRTPFESSNWASWGMNGSFYNDRSETQNGRIFIQNERIYCFGVHSAANSRVMSLYELNNSTWMKINSTSLPAEQSKKSPAIKWILLNEGLMVSTTEKGNFLSMEGEPDNRSFLINKFTPSNPSKGITKSDLASFGVSLPGGELFLDPSQLGKKGSIKLVYKKK